MQTPDPRRDVVQASHILFATGVVDGFGHVSQRSAERPDRFRMSRRMAPGLISVGDVLEHNADGDPIEEPDAQLFLERFIHSEIYRRRPDVMAIVHSHARVVLPFTVVPSVPLRPICHMCGFLRRSAPPFDVADVAGDGTNLLIRSAELGRALAEHMGDSKVVLMRGHGFTAVGSSIQEAVFNAYYTQVNAETQKEALQLGAPRYLTDAEAAAVEATTLPHVGRSWDLWVRQYAAEV